MPRNSSYRVGLLLAMAVLGPGWTGSMLGANYQSQKTVEDGVEVVQLSDKQRHTTVTVVPSVGNIAVRMLVNGKNVFYFPYESIAKFREKPKICGIPLLAPWADRLDEQAFYANGKRYPFNVGLGNLHIDNAGHPIHGFLSFAEWQVTSVASDKQGARVTSKLEVWKRPEWMAQFPFAHDISMTYVLHEGVLEVRTAVTNLGSDPMPLSIGYHSFYNVTDAPRKDWTISLGAKTEWPVNKELLPTGQTRPLGELVEHPEQFVLGNRSFDNVLGDLARNEQGRAPFVLKGKQQTITVLYGEKFRAGEIWAPPGKDFLCFEPMVGINNALNLAHRGVYKELQSIAPGETWQESFWIQPAGF